MLDGHPSRLNPRGCHGLAAKLVYKAVSIASRSKWQTSSCDGRICHYDASSCKPEHTPPAISSCPAYTHLPTTLDHVAHEAWLEPVCKSMMRPADLCHVWGEAVPPPPPRWDYDMFVFLPPDCMKRQASPSGGGRCITRYRQRRATACQLMECRGTYEHTHDWPSHCEQKKRSTAIRVHQLAQRHATYRALRVALFLTPRRRLAMMPLLSGHG